MRQLAIERNVHEFVPTPGANGFDINQVMMLAIERALVPPIVHSRNTFQPMRVIVVDRRLGNSASGEIPRLLPRTLPANAQFRNETPQIYHRAVRGEILSDEQGRLYEKLGRQIRPIHQLASGPFGEVIDLVPSSPKLKARPQTTSSASHQDLDATTETDKVVRGTREGELSRDTAGESKFAPLQKTTEQVNAVSHRKLFADPGQWRVLWWGEFKEILARQLAHPERLRDTYRLPCYVQVIETERDISITELASIYQSEKNQDNRLYLLTEEIAAKLDLVLPLRPVPVSNARRPANTLAAHERVFRLLAANDPTIDVATLKKTQQPLSTPVDTGTKPKTVEPTTADVVEKTTIPSRFVKEWEFRISREEAIYDLNAKPTLGSVLRNFLRGLSIVKTRNEITKWQTLLAGRSGDEQLWAVRPPAEMLSAPFVSDWATRALELAGYNSQKMFREWQIFWCRKGH